jgi:cell division GTPase FtsZ
VRNRTAGTAISHLKREADLVVRFSNQKLMEVLGDDVTQDDFFTRQNQRIAVCVRGLMDRVNPIC